MENLDRIMEAVRIAGISGGLGFTVGTLGNAIMRPEISRRDCAITVTALAPLASAMIADGTFGTNPYHALTWVASAAALAVGAYIGTSIAETPYRATNPEAPKSTQPR